MERMTYRDKDGFPMMKKRGGFKQEGVERLAAYEDTGLTPQACAEAREAGKVLSSCDISFGRLAELLTADSAGRLVVLPCKVGDTVYILRRTFDGADVVGETELWWTDIPQLGKTVFLTREEAENALEATKDD
jgi:hypothetical protein